MRMWWGAQMWADLSATVSALTLLQAGALIAALYDAATAKVRPARYTLLLLLLCHQASGAPLHMATTFPVTCVALIHLLSRECIIRLPS